MLRAQRCKRALPNAAQPIVYALRLTQENTDHSTLKPLLETRDVRAVSVRRGTDVVESLDDVWLLVPPYRYAAKVVAVGGTHTPPLGSVAFAAGPSTLGALALLGRALVEWPWVAPCLGVPGEERDAMDLALPILTFSSRLAIAVGSLTPSAGGLDARDIANSAASRAPPNAAMLARWIGTRLGIDAIVKPIEEQFEVALGERSTVLRSTATYTRVFAGFGKLRPHDWRAVARLARTSGLPRLRPSWLWCWL
jgi:hypothetical protein